MALLIGGFVAAVVGLVGLIEWRHDFFVILKGSLPIILLLGGILAIYVGVDEIQEKSREDRERQAGELERTREEIEMVKSQAEQCRVELQKLKEERDKLQP